MSAVEESLTVSEAILSRRSVRDYSSRVVGQDIIRILLQAAVHAPTAIHQEPWGFVIIQNSQILKTLSDDAKPRFIKEIELYSPDNVSGLRAKFNDPDYNIFYNAGTLIIICGKSSSPFYDADCWMAAENLMLAACAMGLGTCVIGSALPTIETNGVKATLGIPPEFTVVAPIIVGYPSGETAPTSRKKPLVQANIANQSVRQLIQ